MEYRVFLVDDEVAIREGIRNSRLWEEGKYTLVGEAPDGEMALSMIGDERPDILITDVRMPFMDGMQLAREVSRQMPWIQIIILSGYDDFNYAREAMSLGVQEYLLKPVSAWDIVQALDRAVERLERERQRSERIESLRRRMSGANRFLRDKLMSAILSDTMEEAEERDTVRQLKEMGVDLTAGIYLVEDISWESEDGDYTEGQDALYGLAENSGSKIHTSSARHGALALILGEQERDLEERAYAFARSVLVELQHLGCRKALVTVGDAVYRLGKAADSAHAARHVRHLCASAGRDTGFTVVGSKEIAESEIVPAETDVRPLYERLQYAQASEVTEILEEYAATLGGTELHSDLVDNYLRVESLMTASRILREAEGRSSDLPEIAQYERMLSDSEHRDTLDAAARLLRSVLEYRDANRPGRGSATLARARAYIAQHYSDANLMLRDVSEYVGMSESRFSSVFSQQVGITFTEYLTSLRMNKARELLSTTTMRSSQVATAVGYNDSHYFSYLFRKRTGQTPSDYRKALRENDSTKIGEY